ncbi:N-acetyltransferase [Pseudonocardia broussonetiae]|uniref:N-acetyltransferase n=1 Tax=Pseudonocardia broussonetiae TaxID=2736640 RepID=A0A6M6JBN7_9PSEU|nr:N-acetyltransferase [Pseudonocardia broussonetiae]QJY44543.1 N-acetyltransferase [Pseudonocardia broussonetiae]
MTTLAGLLCDAADGRFPPSDGGWVRVPPWRAGVGAVLAFTGFAVLAVDGPLPRQVDGFGGAHDPRLITALAGPDGWIDSLDALLVARGTGGPPALRARNDLADHPRAAFARAVRDDVRVLGRADGDDVAVLGRGIAGLAELSMEVPAGRRGGAGRALVRDALTCVPDGEVVVAAVAPGNAASLRALLAAGFVPIGSSQLFRRAPAP